jgi:hypothetical protein
LTAPPRLGQDPALTALKSVVAPGAGPPLHVHGAEDELAMSDPA